MHHSTRADILLAALLSERGMVVCLPRMRLGSLSGVLSHHRNSRLLKILADSPSTFLRGMWSPWVRCRWLEHTLAANLVLCFLQFCTPKAISNQVNARLFYIEGAPPLSKLKNASTTPRSYSTPLFCCHEIRCFLTRTPHQTSARRHHMVCCFFLFR